MTRSDVLASTLYTKDYKRFWNLIRKTNNNKATSHVQIIDGCQGEVAITERLYKLVEALYNCVNDNDSKSLFMIDCHKY